MEIPPIDLATALKLLQLGLWSPSKDYEQIATEEDCALAIERPPGSDPAAIKNHTALTNGSSLRYGVNPKVSG